MHPATERSAKNSYVILNAATQHKGRSIPRRTPAQDQRVANSEVRDLFDQLGDFA